METVIQGLLGIITSVMGIIGGPVEPPPPLTVVEASAEQRVAVDNAVELFERAGLDLPPLVIEFADDTERCNGHAGLFVPAGLLATSEIDTIVMCHRLRLFLVHELAHAWAEHSLSEASKAQFLEHWKLDVPVYSRPGAVRALDEPTENPDILQFVCGYELLTGNPLPDPTLVSCSQPGSDDLAASGH